MARFRNPVTDIIEYTSNLAYASSIGLIEYPIELPTLQLPDGRQIADLSSAAKAEEDGLTKLSKTELVDRATALGLDDSGTKAQLIERISANLDEEAEKASDVIENLGTSPVQETDFPVTTSLTTDAVVETPATSGEADTSEGGNE